MTILSSFTSPSNFNLKSPPFFAWNWKSLSEIMHSAKYGTVMSLLRIVDAVLEVQSLVCAKVSFGTPPQKMPDFDEAQFVIVTFSYQKSKIYISVQFCLYRVTALRLHRHYLRKP